MSLLSRVCLILALAITWSIAYGYLVPRESETPVYEMFASLLHPDVGLRFIRNSGVCETTPNVGQISGYIDFGTNMSTVSESCNPLQLRITFFKVVLVLRSQGELRNRSIHPVVCSKYHIVIKVQQLIMFRLNGGPGCSSMIGLFQGVASGHARLFLLTARTENGPCKVNPDQQTTVLNPFRYSRLS